MRISVIIPAINEAALIGRAARSAWQAGADEVIVADGGSTDETVAIAKRERCRIVDSPPGRAVQQNAGARQASGEILLFLHADNHLDPSAIEQIRDACADVGVQSGAFKQRIEATGFAYRLLERGNAWRVRWRGLPYGDQAIFLRTAFFETLGRFPEVKLMEDLLLMKKARSKSWPRLLDGPVHIDARRWQRHGVVRQTLRNWTLLVAYRLGLSPDSLARFYRRHD
ncbi:MAG: TIGR04283 family arsenosugar biosynthesis glycosyltransferase [Planctomycetaceae bacterium]|nr:TIGR04283 family arsenosugar biosynthesis glycosyltransferase [Planctomycetales bacterium]MCB9873701.1 TIGR04283 family arsenosugar biosynthesis glycosyltransferase [Planctomycetaceae bacterium]MCB9938164.1 TIGR04283 family arsenosugar biosynthesis glycosyltransferase [Planctomycetaceae bacterium]